MKTSATLISQTARLTQLLRVCTASLALGLPAVLPPAAHADDVIPPPVPSIIQVPAGNTAFLVGHATGTQDYICLPAGAGFAWTFFGPQATLFNDDDKQIITHFLSPNPIESGTPRATWQHSRDTSAVWAKAIATATSVSDPTFVAAGAIPWLLLQVVGSASGPTGGAALTPITFIHRLSTAGGVAPSTGCAASTDVGKKSLVPYMANYFFYKAAQAADHSDDQHADRRD